MGILMCIKGMVGNHSKSFKNDAKKVKVTPKLESTKKYPKHKEKRCW